jgi:hypothetical protein
MIAHAALREVLLWLAQQLGQMHAELLVGKPGNRSNINTAFQRACTVGSAIRSAEKRWPSTMRGR